MNPKTVKAIVGALFDEYPAPKCGLDFQSPLELLVAARLSAQCTDVRVNAVTGTLFEKYKTLEDYANADIDELASMIFSCGLYRTKARDIIGAAKKILEMGKFPETMEEMLQVPGVGRKIANLLMGEIYGDQNVVIADTHCIRLSNRLGFCQTKNPAAVEKALREQLPQGTGFRFSHSLVTHGRRVCKAAKPDCAHCCVAAYCAERKKENKCSIKNSLSTSKQKM